MGRSVVLFCLTVPEWGSQSPISLFNCRGREKVPVTFLSVGKKKSRHQAKERSPSLQKTTVGRKGHKPIKVLGEEFIEILEKHPEPGCYFKGFQRFIQSSVEAHMIKGLSFQHFCSSCLRVLCLG